ncbi:MAG TPA: adenine phosphoribosyltransferase [Polyangiaceae bacterium]|jgi:adenine phosphoribosyltransferase
MPKPKHRPPPLARRTKRTPGRHPKKPTPTPTATRAPAPSPAIVQIETALDFARHAIRDIPDFPKPGIMFKDITPLLASPRAFHIVLDSLAERFIGEHIDVVVGVEARGFVFGGALAARLNASFVPARKPGKLPAAYDSVHYDTEYSTAELQMHKDSIAEESRCIVVDDLLATGGTARAAAELVRMQGGYVVAYAFVIELGFLNGREKLLPVRVETVLKY